MSEIGKPHIVLESGFPQAINVFSMTYIHCKINLEGRIPPLEVVVKYKTKGDMTVYGSYITKKPDAVMCDFIKHKPYKIKLAGFKQKFNSNWYYLTFAAPFDVKINVVANFPSDPHYEGRIDRRKRN